MICEGVIDQDQTKWVVAMALAPKNDGTVQFCTHYRKLNAAIKQYVFPVSHLEDSINSLGEDAVFKTLDSDRGFWKVQIERKGRKNTVLLFLTDFTTFCGRHSRYRMLEVHYNDR